METIDAYVLTRDWRDRSGGLRLTFWATSDRGPLRLVLERENAVLFVPAPEAEAAEHTGLRDLEGGPVVPLYFRTQRALVEERRARREAFRRTYEGDVKPHDRFLMERFVTGGFTTRGNFVAREGFLEAHGPRVRSSNYTPSLSVLSFDIETDGLEGTLFSIAAAGAGGDRVWMVGEDAPSARIEFVPDERSLLRAFLEHVRTVDPDVLVGWNVVEFDLKYLEQKAAALGVRFELGRDRGIARVLAPRSERQPFVARVPGRVVLDGIACLRAATFQFESFRLEDVGRLLLGRGKKIDHTANPVDEIRRLYREDREALAAYNLEDCRLVLDIFEATDLVGFVVQRQTLTGLPMDRQGGSVAAFDNLYLPRLHRAGFVAGEVARDDEEIVRSPGGYVMDSVPGLYENVLVFDFKSLYPSIIRTFKIDPLGLHTPGDDPIPGFEGGTFARENHILPELIETLWAARDVAKREKDAARSRAIKILMNSFYGVLGSGGCRFFDPRLASSITRRGHEIMLESRRLIEARGHQVIYGDTDSLFVSVGPGDEATCDALGKQLAQVLNSHWSETLRKQYDLQSELEAEYETHFLRFLMPTMRGSAKGSKKRYAGSVRKGDELAIVIKGLEAVRTDWAPLARRFQRELLRRVFVEEPWRAWLIETANAVRRGEHDDALVFRKRLRRPLDSYVKNVPPHVQAARMLDEEVREVRYVVTTRGAQPVQKIDAPIDYEHYLDKQLAPAADCVLPLLGTSFAALAGTQMVLFE